MIIEMKIVYSALFFMLSILFYIVLTVALRVPPIKNERRILHALKGDKKEDLFLVLATKLSKYIKMNPYQKKTLQGKLTMAGLFMTPETYQAKIVVKAGAIGLALGGMLLLASTLGGFFRMFFMVFLFPLLSVLGILLVIQEKDRVNILIAEKKEHIYWELRRFCGAVAQEIRTHRNVTLMLENYRKSANRHFDEELKVTIADMKTGNWSNALTRMDARISIPEFSEIIRGLNAVINGEDNAVYFQMLEHELKQKEYAKLKQKVMKRPEKIKRFSFGLVILFVLTYLVLFAMILLESRAGLMI